MTIPVKLERLEIKNLETNEVFAGAACQDDFETIYIIFENAKSLPDNDLHFLKMVAEHSNIDVQDMLNEVRLERCGITVSKQYYSWNKIEPFVGLSVVEFDDAIDEGSPIALTSDS